MAARYIARAAAMNRRVSSLTVFAFNLLGDSLRDALDPRLRVG